MENVRVSQSDLDAEPWGTLQDWDQIFTPEEAERELDGFEFRGAGWYFTDVDTVLVIPVSETHFRICVYGDRDPTNAFKWIVNAPVRFDGRNKPTKEEQLHEAITDTDLNYFGE